MSDAFPIPNKYFIPLMFDYENTINKHEQYTKKTYNISILGLKHLNVFSL